MQAIFTCDISRMYSSSIWRAQVGMYECPYTRKKASLGVKDTVLY